VPSGWDKVTHAGAYLVLCVLALRACHGGLHRLGLRKTLIALLLTVGYGMLDELHQRMVPGRHASVLDWLADVVGAIGGVALVGLVVTVRARNGMSGTIEDTRGPWGV
jgi:VanZ family protein